jgi:hypothetical protein
MTRGSQFALLAVVIVGVFAAVTVLTHNVFTAPFPGLNDFMSRWEGARSFWQDGLNPYGEQASLNIQERIYGRPVVEGEDPGYFAYPFYTVFPLWPLVQVDYAWGSAAWMTLLEACLIAAFFLLLNLFGWKPAPWLLGVLVLWTLACYYAARGLILGQPGVLVYFLEVLTLWALVRRRDGLAGVALAFSTIKPQMGYLIVPFLLLWGLRERRWRFVGVFAGVIAALLAASFALQPSWLGDWLAQLGGYSAYTALGSPVWIVIDYYLGLGSAGEWAVILLLYGALLWVGFDVLWGRKGERFLWAAALTLTVTHLVAPRTATPHYVVFMLPLVFTFGQITRHYRRRGGLWVALLALALLVIPWLHFLLTVEGEFEHPTVYLPLPFLMLGLLWFTRRVWWREAPEMAVES